MDAKEVHNDLDKLVEGLVGQQAMEDEWWKPALAELHEKIDDLSVDRRSQPRSPVPAGLLMKTKEKKV